MRILLTGGTGWIGRGLASRLFREGHDLVVLSRRAASAREAISLPCEIIEWSPGQDLPSFQKIDAVIHLAGESVAGRWTTSRKKRILESRTLFTRALIEALAKAGQKPSRFVGASAIGFYGDRQNEQLTENSSAGGGFLAEVCQAWEAEIDRAREGLAAEVCKVRIGIVLGQENGALAKLLSIFQAALGGKAGSGRQWMSWIHYDDLVSLLLFAATKPNIPSLLNGVAPTPVTNAEFSESLARTTGTHSLLTTPSVALKALLGEMAALVLGSQRVSANSAIEAGFQFRFSDLRSALADLIPDGDSVFESDQWVARSLDEVFAFFSDAQNLERITPEWVGFKILRQSTPQIQQGTLIDYSIRIHGLPVNWRTEITDWSPPSHFIDVQLKGPYSRWHHTHRFEPLRNGTLMKDRVRYRVPMGPIGNAFAGSFVRNDVRKIFAYRTKVIREIFGSTGQ